MSTKKLTKRLPKRTDKDKKETNLSSIPRKQRLKLIKVLNQDGNEAIKDYNYVDITELLKPKEYNEETVLDILEIWANHFLDSTRNNTFPVIVADALRNNGYSLADLNNLISQAQLTPSKDRTIIDIWVLKTLAIIDLESENARNEGLTESWQGIKFLQSAQRGYSEKTSMELTVDRSFEDIIKANMEAVNKDKG